MEKNIFFTLLKYVPRRENALKKPYKVKIGNKSRNDLIMLKIVMKVVPSDPGL